MRMREMRFSREYVARKAQAEADAIRAREKLDDRIGTIQLWDRTRRLSYHEIDALLARAVEYGKAEALEAFALDIWEPK